MAEQLSDSQDEIRLDLLREIEETNQRIEEQIKRLRLLVRKSVRDLKNVLKKRRKS